MSICRGREVTVISEIHPKAVEPIFVMIQHENGMREKVKLSDVYFTKEEKRELQKNRVDNIQLIPENEENKDCIDRSTETTRRAKDSSRKRPS